MTQKAAAGEMERPTKKAGTAPKNGPAIGTASSKPATIASSKVWGRPIKLYAAKAITPMIKH